MYCQKKKLFKQKKIKFLQILVLQNEYYEFRGLYIRMTIPTGKNQ